MLKLKPSGRKRRFSMIRLYLLGMTMMLLLSVMGLLAQMTFALAHGIPCGSQVRICTTTAIGRSRGLSYSLPQQGSAGAEWSNVRRGRDLPWLWDLRRYGAAHCPVAGVNFPLQNRLCSAIMRAEERRFVLWLTYVIFR